MRADRDESIGRVKGEPDKHRGVDEGEDGPDNSEAEADGNDGRDGNPRFFDKHPQAQVQVLGDVLKPRRDPHIARALARDEIVADLTLRPRSHVWMRHAFGAQLVGLHLAMELELGGEVVFLPLARHEKPQPPEQVHRQVARRIL